MISDLPLIILFLAMFSVGAAGWIMEDRQYRARLRADDEGERLRGLLGTERSRRRLALVAYEMANTRANECERALAEHLAAASERGRHARRVQIERHRARVQAKAAEMVGDQR